jgi:hypothetical protein
VLSLLLALVVSSGSRIRTALVGLAFLTVAVSTYGLFMAGLFGVLSTVGVSLWVRLAVTAVAVGFAALNIKDYFWFQVGPSLALSDRYKPGLFRRMRGLLAPGMSGPALMGGAAVMALGVTLVELPCTAGLPLLWARRERPDARRHVSHAYLAKRRRGAEAPAPTRHASHQSVHRRMTRWNRRRHFARAGRD